MLQPQTSTMPKPASAPRVLCACPLCGGDILYSGNGRPRDSCCEECKRTLAALDASGRRGSNRCSGSGGPRARRAARNLKSRLVSLANRVTNRAGRPLGY